MTTVTASEMQKNFGRYQAQAQREAVKVTSHGRDSVVLISAADYERFKSIDDRVAMHPADLPDDLAQALTDSLEDMKDIEAAPMKVYRPR
jgi:prevent-host-death family protein